LRVALHHTALRATVELSFWFGRYRELVFPTDCKPAGQPRKAVAGFESQAGLIINSFQERRMFMRAILTSVAVLLAVSLAVADDAKKAKSGCPVGGQVSPFEVHDVTGPNKGKEVCYVCQNGARPVVLIFSRQVDKGVASLVKAVDEAHKGKKNAGAFLVLLEKDQRAGEEKLAKLQAETGASIPLTVNKAGEKSPEGYSVNADVKNTILVYKDRKVVNNFALDSITEKDVKEIVEAAKKNMGG
jgi:hypothetical protein